MSQTKRLLRCVLYLRCSSKQQELSIDQQRNEVTEYAAKKGYKIVREFVDQGKSASKDTEKRVAFHQMIADSDKREFDVVVCWDAARFTRLDGIDGNLSKQILRTNGVCLDTLKEGEFRWDTTEGRWKDMAYCEANKAAALNLSKDSIRGRRSVCQGGYWPIGMVPYGYDKRYTDGTHSIEVRRAESFKKGRNWHLRLTINQQEARIVQEIFKRVANCESFRSIAVNLSQRNIPAPENSKGKSAPSWHKDSIRHIVAQSAYIGTATIGRSTRKRSTHNQCERTEMPNACTPILDARLWERANDVLRLKKEKRWRPESRRASVLSGFLLCGNCGYRMRKAVRNGKPYFRCTSPDVRPHLGCRQITVYEHAVLPEVLQWVHSEMGDTLQQAMQDDTPTEETNLLRGRVKTLTDRLEAAQESALLAPPTARERAWKRVAEMQDELDQTRERLSLLEGMESGGLDTFADDLAEWGERLVSLGEIDDESYVDRDELRGFLARLGFALRIHFQDGKPVRQEISVEYHLAGHSSTNRQVVLSFRRSRDVKKTALATLP